MNLLFLRGQVPQDRDPKQIMFNDINECDDVWTQLAYNMLSDNDNGELWYWNGKREMRYSEKFIERWVPDFGKAKPILEPDVIFARGGFKQYDVVLKKYPKAFKIYYGAGRRFLPQSGFKSYDLILVDTETQKKKAAKEFPKSRIELLVKPASDNIFKPQKGVIKSDAIFCANEHSKGIKGHEFVLNNFPSDMKMTQLGIVKGKTKNRFPNIDFKGWVPRKDVVRMYSEVKFAIVWCRGNFDSCPRVIPEALACNCPLLIFDETTFWHEKYINKETGIFANKSNFAEKCKWMNDHYHELNPKKYYDNNLSLKISANRIREYANSR